MTKPSYAISMYKKGQLCGANPFELLMVAYSEAIWGCTTQNATHATAAIHVLVDSLDPEDPSPLSKNLIKSYAVCLNLIERNKYTIAADLLQALRKSWREAHQQI
ncbi:MAG: hypothetical protein AB8G77_07605 [Rhodothermales bacterium]